MDLLFSTFSWFCNKNCQGRDTELILSFVIIFQNKTLILIIPKNNFFQQKFSRIKNIFTKKIWLFLNHLITNYIMLSNIHNSRFVLILITSPWDASICTGRETAKNNRWCVVNICHGNRRKDSKKRMLRSVHYAIIHQKNWGGQSYFKLLHWRQVMKNNDK